MRSVTVSLPSFTVIDDRIIRVAGLKRRGLRKLLASYLEAQLEALGIEARVHVRTHRAPWQPPRFLGEWRGELALVDLCIELATDHVVVFVSLIGNRLAHSGELLTVGRFSR